MNILFLAASTGGGHVKASQALMEHMESRIPGCNTRLVDTLRYINPAIDKLITGAYLQTIKRAPCIYGKLYDLSEKDEIYSNFVKSFNSILAPRLLPIFAEEKPDAVVCTHTIPLQMVSQLKIARYIQIPTVGIVTDYTNHFFWKLAEVDAFIVAHECIKSDMVKMGTPKDRIYTYGIPISRDFTVNTCYASEARKINQNRKPLILLMGGSMGLCNMKSIFTSLLELKNNIRVIAVTGHNIKLRHELERLTSTLSISAMITGFTNDISQLMDAASLIITKPGGITVSEAIVKRLPIFMMKPLPGQEERNAEFLTNAGAAVRLPNDSSLPKVIKKALDSPLLLEHMSTEAWKLAKPNACEDICLLIRNLVIKNYSYAVN